jgi:hypothetical protein
MKWQKANSLQLRDLDKDLSGILGSIRATSEAKADSHPRIIYEICIERFVVKETEKSRRRKCKELREDIKKLKEAYLNAPTAEKEAIDQLQEEKLK